MNNTRRKAIQNIIDKLDDLMQEIEALQEEEQEALDNMPESLQESERGQAMQEAVENLEYAASAAQDVLDYLNESMQ